MKRIIEVDDQTAAGKRIMYEVRHARRGVKEHSPALNGCPEGYTCGEEAYRKGLDMITRLYKKHGLLE